MKILAFDWQFINYYFPMGYIFVLQINVRDEWAFIVYGLLQVAKSQLVRKADPDPGLTKGFDQPISRSAILLILLNSFH